MIIVEDEPLLTMLLEDFIDTLGLDCVGSASTLEEGFALVRGGGFDTAILDLNLGGDVSWPIADELADRSVPFLVATGGAIHAVPPRHQNVRTLAKPYSLESIQRVLEDIAQEL